ncbi:hypothetical protein ACFE04_029910 [Oxalis oulophora]
MGKIRETFFLSHGSPTLSIDDSLPMRHFMKAWKHDSLLEKPNSILIISPHWDTSVPIVNVVNTTNETIYDFHDDDTPDEMFLAEEYDVKKKKVVRYCEEHETGRDKEKDPSFCNVVFRPCRLLHQLMCQFSMIAKVADYGQSTLKYPAPGAPELAKRVKDLLMASGFDRVDEDTKRGLDHGAWVPLILMYPEADIPVCQLSLQSNEDGTYHYNMGKALAPLKDEGVLIIGSGSATHNIRSLQRGCTSVFPWAEEFDTWIKDALLNGRYEDVNDFETKAPHAKMAHPHADHFYPLHVAMGAAGENAKAKLIHHSWDGGALSFASYSFTSTAD